MARGAEAGGGALRLLAVASCVLVGALVSCGSDSRRQSAGGTAPPFADTVDASVDAAAVPLCPQTTCSAPFATCPKSRWSCDTNLSADVENCGACGARCPADALAAQSLNMTFACVDGRCAAQCATEVDFGTVRRYADCNASADDGCEVLLGTKSRCSSCGDTCPGSLECVSFQCACRPPRVRQGDQCVCPAGSVECTTVAQGAICVDLTSDDDHCSACGAPCTTQPGPAPNTYLGCLSSTCGQTRCTSGWFDCDGSTANGCESQTDRDPKNCGACGNACPSGQQCFRSECVCAIGTFCTSECADLQTDARNCGRCGSTCPGQTASDAAFFSLPSPNGGPSCTGGRCDYTCEPGWADCDEDITNGCESDILTNPLRCGACDRACDVRAGQICSRGKCAVQNCTTEIE